MFSGGSSVAGLSRPSGLARLRWGPTLQLSDRLSRLPLESPPVDYAATLEATLGGLTAAAAALDVDRRLELAASLGGLTAAAELDVDRRLELEATLGGLTAAAALDVDRRLELEASLGGLSAAALLTVTSERALVLAAPLGRLVAAATLVATPRARKLERLAGPLATVVDFSPRRRRAQARDSILVRLNLKDATGAIDFSTAPVREFVFRKPSGAAIVRTATAPATLGRLEFRFAAGDLDEAGTWTVQARVVKASGAELRSAPFDFEVGWNLPTS